MRKNKRNIFMAILISAVLCGCGNTSDSADDLSETIPAEISVTSDTETASETETVLSSEETSQTTKKNAPRETITSAGAAASENDELFSEESTPSPTETTAAATSQTAASTVTTTAPITTAPSESTFKTVDKSRYKDAENVVFADYFADSLFVGDSICSGLKIYGGCLNVENVAARLNVSTWGINKYTFQYKSNSTAELDALSIVKLYQPKNIYIWMGMNDLYVVSAEKYAENLCSLAKSYMDVDPDCKVYAVSISPMSSTHKWNVELDGNNRINVYNSTVEKKCSEVDYLTYINIHDCLTDKYGYLASENNGGDGIHLSASAYKKVLAEVYYFMENETTAAPEEPAESVTETSEETTVTTAPEEDEETTSHTTTVPPEETTEETTVPSETETTEDTTKIKFPSFEELQSKIDE